MALHAWGKARKRTDRSDSVQAGHGESVVALILAGVLLLSCYLLVSGCYDEVCNPMH